MGSRDGAPGQGSRGPLKLNAFCIITTSKVGQFALKFVYFSKQNVVGRYVVLGSASVYKIITYLDSKVKLPG